MAKIPANRPASGEAFIQSVEQLLAASPQAASISQARAARKRAQGTNRLAGSTQRTTAVTSTRPAWLVPAAGVALAAVIGVVLWIAMRPDDVADVTPTDPISSTDPGSATTDPITMTVVKPDDPTIKVPKPVDDPSNEIASLLMQADTYKDFGINKEFGRSLTFPPGDNAVDLYKRVLEAEPGNAAAMKGLGEVAGFYLKSANGLCERTLWPQCRDIAKEGLKAEADNTELKSLLARAEKQALGG